MALLRGTIYAKTPYQRLTDTGFFRIKTVPGGPARCFQGEEHEDHPHVQDPKETVETDNLHRLLTEAAVGSTLTAVSERKDNPEPETLQ